MSRKPLAALAAVTLGLAAGQATADEIRVGVVAPFSGPFALYGTQFRQAIEAWQATHGTRAGDHEISFVYKDSGGVNPDLARSLSQELVIRDRVDVLAGYVFTPNALSVAQLATQSETPVVIFNAATSAINAESPFFLRTSYTLPQVSAPLADWAYAQGIRSVVTTVADYGPGIDAETAFSEAFTARGGAVTDTIRMPLSTTDFAPFLQSVRATGPEAVFVFLPGGPPTFAYAKAYAENGLKEAGITFLGTAETEESNLQALGDGALGLHTAYHYSAAHDSDANRAFLAAVEGLGDDAAPVNWASVGAWDGADLIYRMVEAAGADGRAAIEAALGAEWESPRGPVRMDPESRTLVQNVYIREVTRNPQTGLLENAETGIIATVGDLGWKD
ncbi:ABC transporter substrate-binding protein [Mangrovicoccus algicola]|uniref:ABC transporter substrate-binding protein n=1 Tax=Mangrovicoccus algicola TaxID=2771008 RepID=A0A8J6Z874_9RHOB|nr:ABC transporter substrate-binding protein [Mangrovicoccus algicola]MBE3637616.1 ABC transporter substrate-binding protein [Mangrovicoccus algicola]